MAHRGLKALSAESAGDLANKASVGRALATVVLGLPDAEEGVEEGTHNIAMGYLVYVRQGGFLVVLPCSEEVRLCLDTHGEEISSAPAYRVGELDIETPRGRPLGREDVDMVDLSWDFIHCLQEHQHFEVSKELEQCSSSFMESWGVLQKPQQSLWPTTGSVR